MQVEVTSLVLRTGTGDMGAFSRLYDLIAPRAYADAMRMTPSRASADAALNDALVDVWRRAPLFDPHSAPVLVWIDDITHRHTRSARV